MIKLHAVINIKNFNIIDHSITDEYTNDAMEGINIIRRIKNRINKLYSDKGIITKLFAMS